MEVYKSFATEDELKAYNDELTNNIITELGVPSLDELKDKLGSLDEISKEREALKLSLEEMKQNENLTEKELKRKYSAQLGINLFEENSIEEFVSAKKSLEEAKTMLENENSKLLNEKTSVEVENSLLKLGVQAKRVERAKGLVINDMSTGKTLEEAVTSLKSEFPDWMGSGVGFGSNLNPDNSTLTERERYYKEKYGK